MSIFSGTISWQTESIAAHFLRDERKLFGVFGCGEIGTIRVPQRFVSKRQGWLMRYKILEHDVAVEESVTYVLAWQSIQDVHSQSNSCFVWGVNVDTAALTDVV